MDGLLGVAGIIIEIIDILSQWIIPENSLHLALKQVIHTFHTFLRSQDPEDPYIL
jgi:hypothetical protein